MPTVHVEIWSDVACPFCYMNKRRFEAALADFEHEAGTTVVWRSFELEPEAPAEEKADNADRLAAKYGWTREQAVAKLDQLAQMARGDGLDFRYDLQRPGNTFAAHRVIHLAAEYGLAGAVKERLMRAFWSEGALLANHDTLVQLAADAGVPEEQTRALMDSDRFAQDVREDERAAQAIGVTTVPAIAINGKLAGAGAKSREQLLELLRVGWAEAQVTPAAT
jgi:predicted DsbA family dithiol-disulfide isomerase